MPTGIRFLKRALVRPFAQSVRRLVDAVCLRYYGGIGDHLMLTTITRELKRRGQHRVLIISEYAELFHHNPDVDGLATPYSRLSRLFERLAGDRVVWPTYMINHNPITEGRDQPPDPVPAYLCRKV